MFVLWIRQNNMKLCFFKKFTVLALFAHLLMVSILCHCVIKNAVAAQAATVTSPDMPCCHPQTSKQKEAPVGQCDRFNRHLDYVLRENPIFPESNDLNTIILVLHPAIAMDLSAPSIDYDFAFHPKALRLRFKHSIPLFLDHMSFII